MRPVELLDEIDRINDYGICYNDRKEILELIEQAKTEWEKEAYENGYNEARREFEVILYNPEP